MLARLALPSLVQNCAKPLTTFNEIKLHLMSLGMNLGESSGLIMRFIDGRGLGNFRTL